MGFMNPVIAKRTPGRDDLIGQEIPGSHSLDGEGSLVHWTIAQIDGMVIDSHGAALVQIESPSGMRWEGVAKEGPCCVVVAIVDAIKQANENGDEACDYSFDALCDLVDGETIR